MATFKRLRHAFRQAKRDLFDQHQRERKQWLADDAKQLIRDGQAFVAVFLTKNINQRPQYTHDAVPTFYWKWNKSSRVLTVYHDKARVKEFRSYHIA